MAFAYMKWMAQKHLTYTDIELFLAALLSECAEGS